MTALQLPATVGERLRASQAPVVVTGASGWMGRAALDLLEGALGPDFATRVQAFASAPKDVLLASGTVVQAAGLDTLARSDGERPIVLHFAFLTKDRVADLGVDRFVTANVAITTSVLTLLRERGCAGLLYASSGAAVSGPLAGGDLAGDPYGTLKRLDELLFRQAVTDIGSRIAVTRVFALTGRYMTKPRYFALGDLLLQAIEGRDLVVRARHPVLRSYAAVADVVAVGLAHLVDGGDRELVVDVGADVVEVGELAERVQALVGPALAVVRPPITGAADRYTCDGAGYAAVASALGVELTPLDAQILETAEWLRELGG